MKFLIVINEKPSFNCGLAVVLGVLSSIRQLTFLGKSSENVISRNYRGQLIYGYPKVINHSNTQK